mgnify:FL=1
MNQPTSDGYIPERPKANVALSIGSNCGNRHRQVSAGIDWLKEILTECEISEIYATGDCSGGNREYMNAVVAGKTSLGLKELEISCKEYERRHGRTPTARANGDVPVDIDTVVYDGYIVREKDYRQTYFQIGLGQCHRFAATLHPL